MPTNDKIPSIPNFKAREYVQNHREFNASNLYARWVKPYDVFGTAPEEVYVVFSYGAHFPLYAYMPSIDRWFANSDKYSRTTSRHASQAHPCPQPPAEPCKPLSTAKMLELVGDGLSVAMSS